MGFKSKAELQFEIKLKRAMDERDFDLVAQVLGQYECYLMLIEPWPEPKTKELVFAPWVRQDEPSPHEEIMHVLDGGSAQFAVEYLGVDPLTNERFPIPPAMILRPEDAGKYRRRCWIKWRDFHYVTPVASDWNLPR